ncbi:glycosyltransferase [uncultured Lentibacter sp.]|uniref:glycosyltransferase n=1 Tax=uncultured Lentibacter sp. TaxID=1659309 RepID=UPI0026116CDA|nr:glycosyltransferase [uncultured Lentibacter sp.]
MRQAKLQVLGLCRWSYPSQTGAFNNKGESLEALQRELYAEARMAVRLFFLEHLVLPSLRAQSDPDFTLVLMLGERLPEPWRSRVLELVQDVAQVKPVFLPEGQNHMEACTALMRDHRDLSADVVVEFRLDDDDAVACDFVAQLRGLYRQLRPIYKANKRVAVDFCRGFLFRCEADGGVSYLPVEARLWTPALALYLPPDHPRSLLNYPHMRTWRTMPVLSLNKRPMFVRGGHDGNDSAIKERKVDSFRYQLEKLPAVMAAEFGIDLEAFEAAWAKVCA